MLMVVSQPRSKASHQYDQHGADSLITQRFVVMGVAGCGKSSVAAALAERIDGKFIEGDDLHDASSIEKMSRGEALTDADRWPWLERLGLAIAGSPTPVVASCSSLKRSYRDRIRQQSKDTICFVHLTATFDTIEKRMKQRSGHFMPAALLASQFEALEPLQPDEAGMDIEAIHGLQEVVSSTLDSIIES